MIDFIHIGLPKAASTWLQTGLFLQHRDLEVISKVRKSPQQTSNLINGLWTYAAGKSRDNDNATIYWQTRFHNFIENNLDTTKIVGISEEELSNGGFVHYIPNILSRIKDIFGTLKIILVLRHPIEYLRSAYSQYIKIGGTATLNHFLDYTICEHLSKRINYSSLIDEVYQLFGKENLLLLPFEMLIKEGEQAFINEICDFLGISPLPVHNLTATHRNVKINKTTLSYYLLANHADSFYRKWMGEKGLKPGIFNHTLTKLLLHLPSNDHPQQLILPTPEQIQRLPNIEMILRDENYRFWKDEKAHYNYTFEQYL